MASEVHVIKHPLIQHKLTLMREQGCPTPQFRGLLDEIAMLLCYEVTRDLKLTVKTIETPLCAMESPVLDGRKVVLVSILRAGEGLLSGMLRILGAAHVGHIGLYRDEETLKPVEYYFRVPSHMDDRHVVVVDPMLATGNSAAAAVARIKELSPLSIKFCCLLAAPEGIKQLHAEHPDVDIYTAAVDSHLNENGYIVPGLGDAGDRIFGTYVS